MIPRMNISRFSHVVLLLQGNFLKFQFNAKNFKSFLFIRFNLNKVKKVLFSIQSYSLKIILN